jgi:hypothetical protein
VERAERADPWVDFQKVDPWGALVGRTFDPQVGLVEFARRDESERDAEPSM